MRLFWRKGYAATSIQDLVDTLHLSRSSLYDTFGDKRTLFLAALQLYSERVISQIARTLNESPTPLGGIEAVFDNLTASAETDTGAMGCFMVNSVAELVPYDREVTKLAAQYSKSLQKLFKDALTKAVSDGSLRTKQTPAQLAAFLFNAVQGIRILIKSGATREQMQAITAITLKSLK